MAETHPTKRHKEEEQESHQDSSSSSDPKRLKPCNTNSLSLLDHQLHEEDKKKENGQITLQPSSQDQLSSTAAGLEPPSPPLLCQGNPESAESGGGDQSVESEIRRLLEASDDELGIPNTNGGDLHGDASTPPAFDSGKDLGFDFCDQYEFWKLEDEAANYYAVLQSQLFM